MKCAKCKKASNGSHIDGISLCPDCFSVVLNRKLLGAEMRGRIA